MYIYTYLYIYKCIYIYKYIYIYIYIYPCEKTLQRTATHCNTLRYTVSARAVARARHRVASLLHARWRATHCNTPQHTATHCNTLQPTK